MDGLETATLIRSRDRSRSVPIVAWTAYAVASDEARARAAGCDDFLSKPVDIEQIRVVGHPMTIGPWCVRSPSAYAPESDVLI